MLSTLAPIAAGHWAGPVAGGFGFLFLIIPLFWIGLIVLFVSLGRRRWARGHGPGWGPHAGWRSPSGSAEASLAERFAQGDIDEKEYRARLEVLRANQYPGTAPR